MNYDPEAFFALVEEMRKCQIEYFQTRNLSVLNRSKSVERKVDAMIKDKNSGQKNIFDHGKKAEKLLFVEYFSIMRQYANGDYFTFKNGLYKVDLSKAKQYPKLEFITGCMPGEEPGNQFYELMFYYVPEEDKINWISSKATGDERKLAESLFLKQNNKS